MTTTDKHISNDLAKRTGCGWVVVWEGLADDDSGNVTRRWLGPWFGLDDATAAATRLHGDADTTFVAVAHLSYTLAILTPTPETHNDGTT